MRAAPIWLVVTLLLTAPVLGGCADDFDLDKLDFFHLNEKKKLPGERKPLFPEGVPGVSQGIPPELVKGHQPAETAVVPEEEAQQDKAAQEKPKPQSQPKPRVVRQTPKPAQKPTQIQVTPAQPQQGQQPQQTQQQPAPAWPDPAPQAQQQQSGAQSPWLAPPKQTSPWPDAPPPNTFQR